jgi:hypothetical protein
MDIKKRVNKLYQNVRLSKMKTEFYVISKEDEPPPIAKDTIQVVLVL